jgi:hypothetical protein
MTAVIVGLTWKQAQEKGVQPPEDARSMSARPRHCVRYATMSTCPSWHATMNGELPSQSMRCGSTPSSSAR